MLDRVLSDLYAVETGALNRAVKRNASRFPSDFMFQLHAQEWADLKCQFGMSRWGGDRSRPYAFTEQGVAMLSSVLKSERAVQVNVAIMRTFVRLRQTLGSNKDLAERMEKVEKRLGTHEAALGDHAKGIRSVFEDIRRLMRPPDGPQRKIGFADPGK
jgi:hypothetical protein